MHSDERRAFADVLAPTRDHGIPRQAVAIGGQGTTITNPSSLISLAFMAAALLWLAGRAHRGLRISSVLTLPLMFFAVACFLSVLTSQLKTVSAVEFSRILSVIVMAIVIPPDMA